MPKQRQAHRSPCPHCGKDTATVRGTCTECWGSKGGRLFTVRKRGPGGDAADDVDWWAYRSGCLPWTLLLAVFALSILTGWI